MKSQTTTVGRGVRRRERTRSALVGAARVLLAREKGTEASIQEITKLADVGFGSFYNHFATKTELFEAAIGDVLEEHGAMLDRLTAGLDDPAAVFATSLRVTARLPKTHARMADTIRLTGMAYLTATTGLAPRALRDITRGREVGRFVVDRPPVALACVGGALLGVLQLLGTGSSARAVDAAADELAVCALLMLGLDRADAQAVCAQPLPRLR